CWRGGSRCGVGHVTAPAAVVGGTVFGPDGPRQCDVFLAGDRIVRVVPNVGTTGAEHGWSGGRDEGGTVGAGAERSAVVAYTQAAVPVAGNTIPATGGGPGRVDAGADTVRIDARGLVVAPGFVDLQCNGAAGVDLTGEPERLGEVAAVLPRWGVTSWLPTIVTCAARVRRRALAALAA